MALRSLRLAAIPSLVAPIVVVGAATTSSPVSAVDDATTVFINEIHYDNTGGDTGEFVEVAGPAGEDMAGWSLVFYNGNGGASYATIALSGVIPDEGSGAGALSFPQSGIQNGSPDGVALVDGATVVQFLSYEGGFSASNGPAAGLPSTDIGGERAGRHPDRPVAPADGLGRYGVGLHVATARRRDPRPAQPRTVVRAGKRPRPRRPHQRDPLRQRRW